MYMNTDKYNNQSNSWELYEAVLHVCQTYSGLHLRFICSFLSFYIVYFMCVCVILI